jgi:hypothetical protein
MAPASHHSHHGIQHAKLHAILRTDHTNTTAKVVKSKGANPQNGLHALALVFFLLVCYLAFNRIRPQSDGGGHAPAQGRYQQDSYGSREEF